MTNRTGNRKGTGRVDFDKLREMWLKDKTCDEIATALGCSAPYVSATAKQLGLPRRMGGYTRAHLPGLQKLVEDGMSVPDIAAYYGCNENTVYRHIALHGFVRPQWKDRARDDRRVVAEERPPQPEPDLATITGRLIATKGRWSELDKIRQANGWTTTQVQQRFHQAMRAAR